MADRHLDPLLNPDRSLELSGEQMKRLLEQAAARIARYIDELPAQPVADHAGCEELAREVMGPLPERGRPFEELLADLFERWIPKGLGTPSPGYLAYIPGGGLLHSAVADLIASSANRYVGVWLGAPALAQLEAGVVRWFCDIVGYPESAGGYLTTGGSLANWSALFTARRCRLGDDFLDGVIYVSDQCHYSIEKAAVLAGFPPRNIRTIASDEVFRMRPDALAEAIARDRAAGLRPFLVAANAGSTNTGAVDDLQALADLAQREELWLHVDAAYGGFFLLTEQGRRAMAGIERADSLCLDPHKGLFLPYGSGSLLVRERENLRAAHSFRADYMPAMQQEREFVDFCEISPELSRSFRGLRVWLPLAMHGIEPFRRNLEEKLALTHWITERLRALEEIEILAEPQLSIVAFRLARPGCSSEELNRINRDFLERINACGRILLTATMLNGTFAIRICVLSFRTHLDRLEDCAAAIAAALEEMRAHD